MLYTLNQFTTCTEGNINISEVPSINVLLRECAEKVSLFGGQGYKRWICKTSCQNHFCLCRKSNKLCNSKCRNSLSCKNKWHSCWDTPWCFYIFFCFSFLANWYNEKYIFVVFFKGKKFSLESQITCATFKCHNSLSCKNKWHSCWDTPWCFYVFFCFSFLTNWCNEKYIFVFFKGKNFSIQLNSYLSFFPPFVTIYVDSPTQVGDFTYFLKESSHYTHFLHSVLNNLSDIQILHFNIDVM